MGDRCRERKAVLFYRRCYFFFCQNNFLRCRRNDFLEIISHDATATGTEHLPIDRNC